MKRIVVAIDGPAGAGKSSVSQKLAERLGYALLDTGAMFRAVALTAIRSGVELHDDSRLAELARNLPIRFEWHGGRNRIWLADEDVSSAIRTPEVSQGASRVSALPGVRAALLDLQRALAVDGGVVVEGRDIGTVVFPNAAAKFFLTADEVVRAERRLVDLQAAGQPGDLATTIAEQRTRDERDSTREHAPLCAAADAVHVDSSRMSLAAVVEQMLQVIEERLASQA